MATWTCQRQTRGVVCRHENPTKQLKYCEKCGKPRPKSKLSPKSTRDLLPYEECVKLFGNVCNWAGCEVVGTPEKKLHRDHDHATGELRGLLCFQHNYRLRRYLDWEFVRRAYVYLGDHERRMGRL